VRPLHTGQSPPRPLSGNRLLLLLGDLWGHQPRVATAAEVLGWDSPVTLAADSQSNTLRHPASLGKHLPCQCSQKSPPIQLVVGSTSRRRPSPTGLSCGRCLLCTSTARSPRSRSMRRRTRSGPAVEAAWHNVRRQPLCGDACARPHLRFTEGRGGSWTHPATSHC